jgi:GNAT superfamily N-acetyltransferase
MAPTEPAPGDEQSHAHVRAYRAEDAARCCDIVVACLPQLDGLNEAARLFLVDKLVPERLDAELSAIDAFVCEVGGKVVGLAALDGDEAKRLYVDPTAQRRGIGRRLFDAVETLARRRGIARLRGDASPAAAPFYERLGFAVDGGSVLERGPATFRMLTIHKIL